MGIEPPHRQKCRGVKFFFFFLCGHFGPPAAKMPWCLIDYLGLIISDIKQKGGEYLLIIIVILMVILLVTLIVRIKVS